MMNFHPASQIQSAEVVLPCAELEATLAFFTDWLGFRVDAIFPADDPAVAVLSAFGVRLRLQRGSTGDAGTLRLLCNDPAAVAAGADQLIAPNGTRIELVAAEPLLQLPPLQPAFVLSRRSDNGQWHGGRAGMRYRDLIPDRLGGRFIASHILIPDGGPVADYVHFHNIRFQMIDCYRGWVSVVYEDQGPPFVMQAGDCVLQPPQIRHRVLESSPGLEVIEIGCPAEHETRADHDLQLPTAQLNPQRDFGGQRFVWHRAADASWQPWRACQIGGFEERDSGIGVATSGLAGVRVVRPASARATATCRHELEFCFWFVLTGTLTLTAAEYGIQTMAAGDCCVLPAQLGYVLSGCSADLELLEVTLPADFETLQK
jgi:mannose-6-phosphate isomerase-like protein (cupin superfamily)